MIDIGDLKWVAGFLEGEGSFSCVGGIQVSAPQCQRWPLEQLERLFGGHIYAKKHVGANPKWRPISCWNLTGVSASGLMMTLYPLMSPERQMRIRKALSRWREMKVWEGYRDRCPRGHPLSGLNLASLRSRTTRACRICMTDRMRRARGRFGRKTDGTTPLLEAKP